MEYHNDTIQSELIYYHNGNIQTKTTYQERGKGLKQYFDTQGNLLKERESNRIKKDNNGIL